MDLNAKTILNHKVVAVVDLGPSRREKNEKLLEDMDFAKSLEKKYDKLK